MKLFRRISALALALVLVCAFSASAFASTEHDYYEWYPFSDSENIHALVYADIDRYETSGRMEMTNPNLVEQYLVIDLDYSYIDLETGATVMEDATRTSTERSYVDISKVYNSTLIVRMVNATYTFDANITNLSNEQLNYDRGPVIIRYDG